MTCRCLELQRTESVKRVKGLLTKITTTTTTTTTTTATTTATEETDEQTPKLTDDIQKVTTE